MDRFKGKNGIRTFHTGRVFIGGTTEHVWALSNKKTRFNEDLVHPTYTYTSGASRFIDLYVTI